MHGQSNGNLFGDIRSDEIHILKRQCCGVWMQWKKALDGMK